MKGLSRAGVLLAAVVAMAGMSPTSLAQDGSSGAMQNRMPPRGTSQPPRPDRIRVGGGFHAGGYFYRTGGFRYPSPLQRSVFPDDACYGIYDAMVRPGGVYALNMRLPRDTRGTRVYLANRWPVRGNQDLRRLPFNQNGSPLQRGVYRWRFGIAPGSYGSIVYVVVVAPWLCGQVSPYYGVGLDPWRGNGSYGGSGVSPVMQTDGPMHLDLPAGNGAGDASGGASKPQASMPLPGDVIGNPDFSRGLMDWQAVSGGRPVTNADFVRHTRQGAELVGTAGREVGIRQMIGEGVADTSSVILQASLMVSGVRGRGDGASSGLTIQICYTDADGHSHCGADSFRRRFEALPLGSASTAGVQSVPSGTWYHETFDLMKLDPRPVRIDSITLMAPNRPYVTAWVGDIHLLVNRRQ